MVFTLAVVYAAFLAKQTDRNIWSGIELYCYYLYSKIYWNKSEFPMHPIKSTTVFIIVVLHSTATVGRRVIKNPFFLQKNVVLFIIIYIFDVCHLSWAAVTSFKSESDIRKQPVF